MTTRTQILVRGIVQGVGFRPFVYSLAHTRRLKGEVFNNPTGVFIDVEGEEKAIEQFVNEIKLKPPPLSIVESVELNNLQTPAFYKDFRIVESVGDGAKFVPISADIATCKDCLKELFDPNNRRYRYPFINCTNCGPRFTIIENVPYDRARTTTSASLKCAKIAAPNTRTRSTDVFTPSRSLAPIAAAKLFLRSSGFEPPPQPRPKQKTQQKKGRNATVKICVCSKTKDIIYRARQLLQKRQNSGYQRHRRFSSRLRRDK